MSHLDELTLMMFLENELTPEEQEIVSNHLSQCPQCYSTCVHWRSDLLMIEQSFHGMDQSLAPLPLSEHVTAQINAIASIHKTKHQLRLRRMVYGYSALLGALLIGFLFLPNIITSWLSPIWNIWKEKVIWTTTFWMKENLIYVLRIPSNNLYAILLLILGLFAALIVLNTRRPSINTGVREE
ncbi:anti-sigma factor family protein [Brevibacillus massiliensis]|uniref:anti-sigma factor family protein n=1 Tax=Brevibacillus massiliensis TaxID=1118054 RepID=UPI0002DE5639|nr:zf-HC2 domain-containing protein [Brevibacillus massiliensis]